MWSRTGADVRLSVVTEPTPNALLTICTVAPWVGSAQRSPVSMSIQRATHTLSTLFHSTPFTVDRGWSGSIGTVDLPRWSPFAADRGSPRLSGVRARFLLLMFDCG
jgi:hypothetical protein